jgi:hypothetical protein
VQATGGKKEVCKKEGKGCKRKSNMATQEGKPNHDRVRVFDKYCNNYKP